MEKNNQKEQFNIAYVNALAAQAGINPAQTHIDDDSIDIFYTGKRYTGKVRNPQIHLQLKCTSQDLVKGSVIKFRLCRKNYDDLRDTNLLCPRYLVVLIVPKDCAAWVTHGESFMQLSHSCYWVSIKNFPETTKESVTIDVPLEQKLTAAELNKLMKLASDGLSA